MLQVARLLFLLALAFPIKTINTDLVIYSHTTSVWEKENIELSCNKTTAFAPNSNRMEWHNLKTSEVRSYRILKITNVSRYYDNAWTCVLLSESGQTIASKQIQLNITYLDAPQVSVLYNNNTIPLQSVYLVQRNQNITFNCTPTTNMIGNTNTYWTKDGEIIEHGGTLQLHDISVDDSAYYQCTSTLLGRAKKSTWLKTVVQYVDPPMIYSAFDTEIRERFSIYLRCDVNRSGDVTFRWYKDGRLFSNSHELAIETAYRTDGANYTCAVTNGINSYNVTRAVNVYYLVAPYTQLVTPEPIIEGSYFQMECHVSTNHDSPSFYWYKEMRSIVSRSRLLTIDSITRYYSGTYTCFSSLMGLGRFTSSFHLQIHYLDEPSITTQESILTEGEPLLLTCNVVAYTAPQYIWYKDGLPLSNNTRNIFHIMSVRRNDTGSYECMTANAAGNKTTRINVIVHYVDIPVVRVNATEDYLQKMICQANTSRPTGLSYSWYHNDIALVNGSEIYVNRTRSSSGKYICRVLLDHELVKESKPYLYVVPFIEAPNVTILTKPIRELATISIMCGARGYPDPSYEWLKSNTTLHGETLPILTIQSVQRRDDGVYTCRTRNTEGERETSIDIFVNFISKPNIEWRSHNRTSQKNTLESVDWSFPEGESVTLRCIATTSFNMNLTYTWYHNNKRLFVHTKTTELTNLSSVDDGRYRCRVSGMNMTSESDDNQLTVGYFHGIMVKPISTEEILFNRALALECLILSNLNLQKEWEHSVVSNLEELVFFSSNKTVLYVSRMKKSLVGTFKCIAFNNGIRKTATFDVQIPNNVTSTVTPTKSTPMAVTNRTSILGVNVTSVDTTKSRKNVASVQPQFKNGSFASGPCSENWNPCHQDGICHVLQTGTHLCTCKEGFLGNGHSCKKTCTQFDVLLKIFVVAVLIIVILFMVIVAMTSGIIGQDQKTKRDLRKVAASNRSSENDGYVEINTNIFMVKDASSTEQTIDEEEDGITETGENEDDDDVTEAAENEEENREGEKYDNDEDKCSERHNFDENARPSSSYQQNNSQ